MHLLMIKKIRFGQETNDSTLNKHIQGFEMQ